MPAVLTVTLVVVWWPSIRVIMQDRISTCSCCGDKSVQSIVGCVLQEQEHISPGSGGRHVRVEALADLGPGLPVAIIMLIP